MDFITATFDVLKTGVTWLGASFAAMGAINYFEGYGSDNPGAKNQGIKQLIAGGVVILIGTQLIPLLSNLTL